MAPDRESASVIATDRLALMAPSDRHAAEIARLAGAREVAEMTSQIPHPYTLGDAEAWLARVANKPWVRAILHRADERLLGVVSISERSNPDLPWELGFWIGKPYWGRGFMTEAARALVARYFATTAADAVASSALAENQASLRVQEKLGFVRTGEATIESPARGRAMKLVVTRLRRRDFRP